MPDLGLEPIDPVLIDEERQVEVHEFLSSSDYKQAEDHVKVAFTITDG